MIICKVCGTENEQGAGFCGSCGSFLEWSGEAVADETATTPTTVPQPQPPVVDPTVSVGSPDPLQGEQPGPAPAPDPGAAAGTGMVICPACGQANEPDRVYCRRCATELRPAMTTPTEVVSAPPPRGRSGPPVAILGGAAALVLLVALGAFLLLPKGSPTPSSGVTDSTAPSVAPVSVPPTVSAPPPSDVPPTQAPPSASTPPSIGDLSGLVAFVATKDGNADIWVWDPSRDSVRRLVKGPGNQTEPAWAPDGSAVVYRSPDGLRIVGADGKPFDPARVTRRAEDRNPAWSRDGRRIVFSSDRPPLASLNVMTVKVGGSDSAPTGLATSKGDDWDPQFSPDGTTIVFASTREGAGRLFLMDADGSNERLVDLGPGAFDDPMLSPDGEWLAFTRRDDAKAQKDLWVARVDGSEMRQLTDTRANENDLAWSPDGRVIAVARADGKARIVLLDVATGDEIGAFGVDGATNAHPDWWWPQP